MASLLHSNTNNNANHKTVSQLPPENIIKFSPLRLRIPYPLDALHKEYSKLNFINITENDEKRTKDKYQRFGLFKTTEKTKQRSLWQLITVGRKNNYPQLLLLLSSDYSRQRIKYFIKKRQSLNPYLSLSKWLKKSKGCEQIIKSPINSIKHNLDQLIISAINTYQTRMCKPICFGITNQEKINDSIAFFANHIINAISLIKNKNCNSKCQLDVWIIPQKIGENNLEQKNETNNDNDSDDDEFDDDESDDDDDEYQNEEQDNLDKDIEIKNIEQHLKNTIGDENYVKYDNFDKLKKEFMKKIKNDTQNKRYCMIVTRGNELGSQRDDEKVIDDEKSMLYMYRPLIMNNIPNDIPEWGIQAALTDILPSSKCNTFKQIKGNQCLGNKMFLLSLQKDQTNEIRAWLIMRITICRFYTSDILNILPHFFIQNKANQLTKKQYDHLKELISKHEIDDEIFDKFSKKKHNKEKIVSYDKLWRV